jgi:steroid delta-isomerase-like uncharacterized protein
MSTERKRILQTIIDEIWNKGNVEVIDKFYTPNFKNHHPNIPEVSDFASFKKWVVEVHKTLPDFHATIEDMIAEEDKIAVRWTVTGTQKGEFMGIPPTGKKVRFEGMTVYRFEGDKVAEMWWVSNEIAILRQLGVFPPKR